MAYQKCEETSSYLDESKSELSYSLVQKEVLDLGRTKTVSDSEPARKLRPASTPEARENQLISLATDLAERRLREGTASSAEVVHFLKMGSTKEKYELEKVKLETELVRAKTEALQSAKEVEVLYKEALSAMRTYSGNGSADDPI